MPELPEVETIKRYLANHIVAKKIKGIKILKPKSFIGDPKEIIGARISNIERRAKLIILKLSNNKTLLVHLKMSGQLIYEFRINLSSQAGSDELRINKYSRVIIVFGDGSRLIFNDLRIFGWIKIIKNDELRMMNEKFGPEPFAKEFTTDYLQKIFARTRKPIKLVLMDQEKIAGVGNIYANESLWETGIDPRTPANKLVPPGCKPAGKIKKLREAIIKVLDEGIKYKGSSAADETYIQPNGEKGSYQNHFRVYQRDRGKCRRCGSLIKRIKIGGRGTFWCPKCQK